MHVLFFFSIDILLKKFELGRGAFIFSCSRREIPKYVSWVFYTVKYIFYLPVLLRSFRNALICPLFIQTYGYSVHSKRRHFKSVSEHGTRFGDRRPRSFVSPRSFHLRECVRRRVQVRPAIQLRAPRINNNKSKKTFSTFQTRVGDESVVKILNFTLRRFLADFVLGQMITPVKR